MDSGGRRVARFHHDLDARVVFVAECLVEIRAFFECRAMSDDEGRIDLAVLNTLHQQRQIMLDRRLGHAEGQAAVDGRAHRDFVEEAAV